MTIDHAIDALRAGRPIMLFDSGFREAETDLVFPALSLQPRDIRRLRSEAGGLLFLAISHEVGEAFGLPFLQDVYTAAENTPDLEILKNMRTDDLQYDTRSAFSLSLNHRETVTGIPDGERCLTSRRFAELAAQALDEGWNREEAQQRLGREFRTPGHMWICRESEGGLEKRKGHTELMVAAAKMAEICPVLVAAEFLHPERDHALPIDEAKRYAAKHDIPLIEGEQLETALNRSAE